MPKTVVLLLACLVAAPLAACGDSEPPGQVQVAELRLVRQPGGLPLISGVFINRTPERIPSADIGVQLFDDQNLPFEEPARFVVRDIAAGDTVAFRHRIDVDARGARVQYVNAN